MRAVAARAEDPQERGLDRGQPRTEGEGARQPATRRPVRVRRVLLLSVLILLVAVIGGGLLLWQRVAAFNASVSSAASTSFDLFGPLGGKDRVNIALYGYGGPEHTSGTYLADSIQILSIDPVTDTTTLIPIPRDFWVEGLPEIPDNAKINEAFALGQLNGGIDEGGRFMSYVLSQVTGLTIDHWLAIDFGGFREVVDALGGVTITNPTAFSYTWSEDKFKAHVWDGGHFAAGTVHLDGALALDYVRSRYTSVAAESSDFARSVRQQRVLSALRTKLGSGGPGSFGPALKMMDALKGQMRTDMSAIDLFLLSGHLRIDRRLEMKVDEQLVATTNTIGQYILIPKGQVSTTDYGPIKTWLQTELAQPIPSPTASPSG